MRGILIISWLLVSTSLVPVSATDAEVKRVVLRPAAETAGPRVQLAELAEVRGFSQEWQQRLNTLDVGAAALPGQSRRISRLRIEALVGGEYEDGSVYVLGPGAVDVTTRARVLTGVEIVDAVRAHIDANSPWSGDRVRLEFRPVKDEVTIPDRNLGFSIEPVGDCDYLGYTLFNLIAQEDGREVARISVACNIRVFRPVLVSTSRIVREKDFSNDNISLEERELTELRGSPLSSPDEAVGLVATRIISPGRVITTDMAGPPLVILKGDRVQIEALAGQIMIRLAGEAVRDGRVGEFITVRNLSTNKRLDARVIGDHKVQIVF
ncbi:flagellar basal body P-ring formation chaperone FlgA [candidate division KSB1 bacterium]